ncbi:MAG: hypothetical protein EBU59_12860, partial [Planctomycetia bacterium]|nr:hypothetical protein [Planctomycetia bacterium]
EAISAYDAALVLQHDVGLRTLSEQQQVAADTDGNNQVTLMDAARILAKSVGLISGYFPNQTSDWVFEPETRTVSADAGDLTGQDFVGILLGDVSGNWRATNLVADQEVAGATSYAAQSSGFPAFGSLSEPTRVVLGSRDVLPGTTLSLPLEITGSGQGMLSLDAVVTFDPAALSIDPAAIRARHPDSVSVVSNLIAPGQLKLAVASGTPLPTNEELASLPFTVTGLTGATEVAIQTAALNEGLIDSQPVGGGFAALTPIETDGVVVLSRNTGGALYAGNTRLAYEGGDVTERFLNRWAVLAADETAQGPAVLLKQDQDTVPKHRLRADDAWALYGVFEGLGNAGTQSLTPAARGSLTPAGDANGSQQELLRKVIESIGSITLSRDTLGILYANETAIAFGGVATVMGWPDGSGAQYVWPAIAAETIDGTNQMLLRQPEGETYTTFAFDAQWQQVADISENSVVDPAGQAQLWDDEIAFGIDIDLDGEIGG